MAQQNFAFLFWLLHGIKLLYIRLINLNLPFYRFFFLKAHYQRFYVVQSIMLHKTNTQTDTSKSVKWTKFMVDLSLIDVHAYWLSYPLSFTISLSEIKLSELTVELCFFELGSLTQEIILFKLNCFILAFFTFIVGKCNVFPLTCHVGVNICLTIAFFESTWKT